MLSVNPEGPERAEVREGVPGSDRNAPPIKPNPPPPLLLLPMMREPPAKSEAADGLRAP